MALGQDYKEDVFHIMAADQGRFSLDKENKINNKSFQNDIDKIVSDMSIMSLSPFDILCDECANRISNTIKE